MLSETVEKRVNELNTICSEIPLVVANHGWSDYALELVKKLQRIAITMDDKEDDAGEVADDIVAETIRYKRLPDNASPIGGVGVYVVKDGKLLSATRITPNGFGKLCGPGGLIEDNETPRDAAVRETREEFNVEPLELIPFGKGEKGNNGIEPELFLCTEFRGEPKCDEIEMTKPVWKSVTEYEREPDALYSSFADGIQKLKAAVLKWRS